MKTALTATNTIAGPVARFLLVAVISITAFSAAPNANAQQQSGCYFGKDHLGYPAKVHVSVEHYGDWFEVAGMIYSSGADRVYKFKADGHSGAGRLYERHEYESGALYISVQDLTETAFALEVESYGVFHFRRGRC
jgi:hypothetical protein